MHAAEELQAALTVRVERVQLEVGQPEKGVQHKRSIF